MRVGLIGTWVPMTGAQTLNPTPYSGPATRRAESPAGGYSSHREERQRQREERERERNRERERERQTGRERRETDTETEGI
jgi:hypothetical protein